MAGSVLVVAVPAGFVGSVVWTLYCCCWFLFSNNANTLHTYGEGLVLLSNNDWFRVVQV